MTEPASDISVVVRRRVRPGCEAAYEELLRGLLEEAKKFAGHRGVQVIRPSAADPAYQITFHFTDLAARQAWADSEERARWLEPMNVLADEPEIRVLTGLETWFTVPEDAHRGHPPRRKMVVITWIAIFPTVYLFSRVVAPFSLPPVLNIFVVTALTVPFAAYILLPRLTKLFERWLFQ